MGKWCSISGYRDMRNKSSFISTGLRSYLYHRSVCYNLGFLRLNFLCSFAGLRLFTEERFQNLTGAAKLIYMILLDRRCLSELNGDAWRDEYGVIFIFFTIEEIMKLMHLENKKINKTLKELEQHGLI